MPIQGDSPANTFLSNTVLAADNASPDQKDPFWPHASEIAAERWGQVFPYQFMLVKRNKNGKYVQDADTKAWTYTLPFPPSSLSQSFRSASQGTVTQGGYVEEPGGIPLKPLMLQGSLGVMPLRPRKDLRPEPNIGTTIFGGAFQQGLSTASAGQRVGADVQGTIGYDASNLVQDQELSSATQLGKTTGYYQLRLLTKWFEDYARLRETVAGRDYRLVFCMWKHEACYLVTFQGFTWDYSATSPLEPRYQMQLQAYRRITLGDVDAKAAGQYIPVAQRPNGLARVMQALLDARAVIENARDTITAALGDVDRSLFQPLQQSLLFAKDAVGVPLAFADLPDQVLKLCRTAVTNYIVTAQGVRGEAEKFQDVRDQTRIAYRQLANVAQPPGVQTGINAPGVTGGAQQPGVPGLAPNTNLQEAGAEFDLFRNPKRYYDLYSTLQPGQIQLPAAAQGAIFQARAAVQQLTRIDFQKMRDQVQQQANAFADAVGAGNQDFNTIYQRAATVARKTPTADDYRIIYALNRAVLELNRLTIENDASSQVAPRSIDFMAGLASRSGIAFQVPRSKFAIPFPYGVTLEQLALQYLGDPDRWFEIVALNGLRSPYVDEEGFDRPLGVNGLNNQVQVQDATNLLVGQQVYLSANNTTRTQRHILAIDQIPNGPAVLTLDGDPDLVRFTTAGQATLHAFLPGTVNSQMMIYIPSSAPVGDRDYPVRDVPGIDAFDPLLRVAGVDWLLSSKNDLVVTPEGDSRWSYGLQNIIQTARIRCGLVKGKLYRHPYIGLPETVGQSTADVDASSLRRSALTLFSDDPAFTSVDARVTKVGPVAQLHLTVGIHGQSKLIPITLDILS